MKRIRIGNDVRIEWTLLRNGEAESLAGRDVTVSLVHDMSRAVVPFEWACSGNKVVGTFRGKDQEKAGRYSLVFVENAGRPDMHTLDRAEVLALVDRSWKTDGDDGDEGCERLTVGETVELSDDLEFARDGRSAYEIAVLHGYGGTEEEWVEMLGWGASVPELAQSVSEHGRQIVDVSGRVGRALSQIDESTHRVYRNGGYDMNACLWYGWWFGCTGGRPASEADEQYALETVNCGRRVMHYTDLNLCNKLPKLFAIGAHGGWDGTFGYYIIGGKGHVERYYGNYPGAGEEICSLRLEGMVDGVYECGIRGAASSTAERDGWLAQPDTVSEAMRMTVNGVMMACESTPHSELRTEIQDSAALHLFSGRVTVTGGVLTFRVSAGARATANWFVLRVESLVLVSGSAEVLVVKQTCHSTHDAEKVYVRNICTRDRNKPYYPWTEYEKWKRQGVSLEDINELN